jgi:hypothetical protein
VWGGYSRQTIAAIATPLKHSPFGGSRKRPTIYVNCLSYSCLRYLAQIPYRLRQSSSVPTQFKFIALLATRPHGKAVCVGPRSCQLQSPNNPVSLFFHSPRPYRIKNIGRGSFGWPAANTYLYSLSGSFVSPHNGIQVYPPLNFQPMAPAQRPPRQRRHRSSFMHSRHHFRPFCCPAVACFWKGFP